jgi:AcrR family transcriptional regulator
MEDRLVDGARRAIERHGWQAATLERIAEESQVSRMTLHRRGVTRDALLAELGARLQAEHREAMYGPLTAPGTGRERLEQALTAICENAESNLALLAALSHAAHGAVYHETADDGAVMTRPAFTDALQRLLLDGAADGSLREVDALETATVLMNLVGLTYRHLRDGHGWPPERARRGVLEIALQGVTP